MIDGELSEALNKKRQAAAIAKFMPDFDLELFEKACLLIYMIKDFKS